MTTIANALQIRRLSEGLLRPSFRSIARKVLAATPTILVSADFSRYVAAMAEQCPVDAKDVAWPTIEEAHWPFPYQPALFVWEEPITLGFLITQRENEPVEPFEDYQETVSLFVLPPSLTPSKSFVDLQGRPVERDQLSSEAFGWIAHIHPDSLSTGYWQWGGAIGQVPGTGHIGHMTRFDRALVEAVGHRLAAFSVLSGLPRHERRGIARTQAPFRMLDLRTHDRPTTTNEHQSVNWSHRWIVRGHWRNQPYGPGSELRKLIWVDAHIKGPEDRPLDVRPTLFQV
jgi:hypothetical protein